MGSRSLTLPQQGVTFLKFDYPQSYQQILGIAVLDSRVMNRSILHFYSRYTSCTNDDSNTPGKSLSQYIKDAFQEDRFMVQVYQVDGTAAIDGRVEALSLTVSHIRTRDL